MTPEEGMERDAGRRRSLGRGLAALLGNPDDGAAAAAGPGRPPSSLPIEMLERLARRKQA